MDILVTGGAGFIGSHLCEALIKKNNVTVLDKNLPKIEGVDFVKGKITNKRTIEKAIRQKDLVYHLAAQISVLDSVKNPINTFRDNILGTILLLENLKSPLVFISSSSVYGEPKYLPIDENHPLNPKSPYAVSKLAGEHYCRVFHELNGLDVSVLRYFNVYGPRQSGEYAGVVQIFIKKIMKNEQPIIYGDGKQTRDFVYVKDVVDATIKASRLKGFNVLNIGAGTQKSVNEIAFAILKKFKSGLKPIYQPPRPGDPKDTLADIKKAKRILKWKPAYNFKKGLDETIEWFTRGK